MIDAEHANQTEPGRDACEATPLPRECGFAEIDARLADYPDPLAYLTRERFESNRKTALGDTLGAVHMRA